MRDAQLRDGMRPFLRSCGGAPVRCGVGSQSLRALCILRYMFTVTVTVTYVRLRVALVCDVEAYTFAFQ